MRVLLSTYDSRGGVEPLLGLAVQLRGLGAEVLVCGPPDCAERLAEVGVPLVSAGESVRALVHRAAPPSPDDVPRLTAELIATWFDKVAVAADGCDALVASGVIPAAAGAGGPRRGPRRSGSGHRVPVRRAQHGPDPRDPSTSKGRGRHDPHRRGDAGRGTAPRRGQPDHGDPELMP
jgi:hypothetical protein